MFIVIMKIVGCTQCACSTLTSDNLKCLFIFKGGDEHGSRDLINEADNTLSCRIAVFFCKAGKCIASMMLFTNQTCFTLKCLELVCRQKVDIHAPCVNDQGMYSPNNSIF